MATVTPAKQVSHRPTMTTNSSAKGGMVEDLVHSIFNPGVNSSVVIILNVALICLFFSLLLMGFSWEWNIHVFILLFANVGLFFSANWFLIQLGDIPAPADDSSSTTTDATNSKKTL